MKQIYLFCLIFISFSFQRVYAQNSKNELTINLKKGTLNSRKVCSMHVDQVTDLLGRPSTVDNSLAKYVGINIMYHNDGIKFIFKPKSTNNSQPVRILAIYLTKKWDKQSQKWYQQFTGKLTPSINANLKLEDVKEIFSTKQYSIMTPEELYKKQGKNGTKGDILTLKIHYKKHNAIIAFENVTKFAEFATINCVDKNK